MSGMSVHVLTSYFEDEQRVAVFSVLCEYRRLGLFTDVTLFCQNQSIKAHKIVLAASSKFFRDLFNHNRNVGAVDLNKELAPNGLDLTFKEVESIINALYCVGSVDVSPWSVERLLVTAQVLGIPTLINFLKKVKESLQDPNCRLQNAGSCSAEGSLSVTVPTSRESFVQSVLAAAPGSSSTNVGANNPGPPAERARPHQLGTAGHVAHIQQQPFVYVLSSQGAQDNANISAFLQGGSNQYHPPASGSRPSPMPSSSRFEPESVKPLVNFPAPLDPSLPASDSLDENAPGPSGIQSRLRREASDKLSRFSPPSRSNSRATVTSLGGILLQQLPSPLPRQSSPVSERQGQGSRVVTSVLEHFDPSFLNNLPANQIDDLESALMPHLHNDDSGGQPNSLNTHMELQECPDAARSPLDQSTSSNSSFHAIPQESPSGEQKSLSANMRDTPSVGQMLPIDQASPPLHNDNTSENDIGSAIIRSPANLPSKDVAPCGESDNLIAEDYRPSPVNPDVGREADVAEVGGGEGEDATQTATVDDQLTEECPEARLQSAAVDFNRLPKSSAEALPERVMPLTPERTASEPSHNPDAQLAGELVIDEEERMQSETDEGRGSPLKSPVAKEPRPAAIRDDNEPHALKERIQNDHIDQEKDSTSSEIQVDLENVTEGKSLKFAIPGSSKSVTLNFSAQALERMRTRVVTAHRDEDAQVSSSVSEELAEGVNSEVAPFPSETDAEVVEYAPTSSSELMEASKEKKQSRRRKQQRVADKSEFSCPHCNKLFPSQRLLDRHQPFHIDLNRTCPVCQQLFSKKWALDEHLAVVHGQGEGASGATCQECGKEFKWGRNLLAHLQLHHQAEKRYRCKHCPLTFLKKKIYIKHHQVKHSEQPETWCKYCCLVFDKNNRKEDHECLRVEYTGKVFICHDHDEAKEFNRQSELDQHLKEEHQASCANDLKMSCPVCNKTFLMKKNLSRHMRLFHDNEEASTMPKKRYHCKFCSKSFLYSGDKEEHENTHLGEKGKSFICPCGRSYSSKKALLSHQKNAHSQTQSLFKCKICSRVLSNKYKLKSHMLVHTDSQPFQCSLCQIRFKEKSNLLKHMARIHKSSQQDIVSFQSSLDQAVFKTNEEPEMEPSAE